MKTNRFFMPAILTFLLLFSGTLMAQGPGGPPGPPGGTSGPVDSGALALLLGAVAYGYQQLKKQEFKAKEQA
jgi:hypothetical protein